MVYNVIFLFIGIAVGLIIATVWAKAKTAKNVADAQKEVAVAQTGLESVQKSNEEMRIEVERLKKESDEAQKESHAARKEAAVAQSALEAVQKSNEEMRIEVERLKKESDEAQKESHAARKEAAVAQSALEAAQKSNEEMRIEVEHLKKESDEAQKESYAARKEAAVAQSALEAERKHNEEMRIEASIRQEEGNKLVQEEIRNMASQFLHESRKVLTDENQERISNLLGPLKERMEAFNKVVNENSIENAKNKVEIKTAFEAAMKKLHDEQERTVRELREQTERIGNDATNLSNALKGDTKMQGDWGEMILDKTLENSGLIKDQQYFLQVNYKDENGQNFRPDAIVEFPNGERIVIDAKVSLTAYHNATRADDADTRDRLLREHVASVKKHVNELSEKNYEKIVPGCIGYVLMFIPYESGYSAAIRTDTSILQYAYKKQIIILSPSNLLMALQLTHTMWQNFRINANVTEILRQSNDLYDKFVTFAESFVKIESDIQRLRDDYSKVKGQLCEGKGNILRRLDGMKALGISPKKQIPEALK